MNDECTLCGKCCRSLGPYVKIVRRTGQFEFHCFESLSKHNFKVKIQDNTRQLFLSDPIPGACVFLRRNPDREEVCCIYESRPLTCRNFSCKKEKNEDL